MREQRIARTLAAMRAEGLTQILITDPLSIYYFTGARIDPGERLFALYLHVNGGHKMFLNRLFVVPETGLEEIWFGDTDDQVEILAQGIDPTAPLAVDKTMVAKFLLPLMKAVPTCEFVVDTHCVDGVRGRKDEAEQALMVEASVINDKCMAAVAQFVHLGVTEREVAQFIQKTFLEMGASGQSFPAIVGFGANASDPHHHTGDRALEESDCVLVDMGCVYQGYCSDMTRTFFFRSAPEKFAEIYEICRQANENAQAVIAPGVPLCQIDAAARDYITTAGYGDQFTHRLGHFIGMECHEAGDVSANNTQCAQVGMVFSIEPGIYLPGQFGVRIEDLVLVTETGCQSLNHFPKEMKILP